MKNRTRMATSLALATALGCGPTPPTPPDEPCRAISPGNLVITEFMADPAGSDTGKQYVEIYNATDHALDLRGLSLFQSMADGSRLNASVLPSAVVGAHAYFVLGDAGSDAATRPPYLNYGYGSDLGALRHESGKVGLHCSTTPITEVAYTGVAAGRARTLDGAKLPAITESAIAANWCDASESLDALAPVGENFGSPGARNQPCPASPEATPDAGMHPVHLTGSGGTAATGSGGSSSAINASDGQQCFDTVQGWRRAVNRVTPGDLLITEIMPAPSINNNGAGEWFEVLATRSVDLNGLELVNEGTGSTQLASDTCLRINAGDWWVFARSSDPTQNGGLVTVAGLFDFTLADSSSTSYPERTLSLRLDGQQLDRAVWLKTAKGTSLQRSLAGSSQGTQTEWCLAATASHFGVGDRGTPGAANTACTVEPLDAGSTSDAGNAASGGTQTTSAATTDSGSGGGMGGSSTAHTGGTSSVHAGSTSSVRAGGTSSLHPGVGGALVLTGGTSQGDTTDPGSGGAPALGSAGNAGTPTQGGESGTAIPRDAGATEDAAHVTDAGHGHACVDASGNTRTPRAPQPGDLVLTEVMSAPSSSNNGPAEWFEVLVNADLDLNGLEIANESTGGFVVASDACLHVEASERLLFARGADFEQNGGLPFVTFTFAFTLADSASNAHPVRAVILRFDGTELSRAEWVKSTKGASWQRGEAQTSMLDGGVVDGGVARDAWCLSPTGLVFGFGDRGTPGSANLLCDETI